MHHITACACQAPFVLTRWSLPLRSGNKLLDDGIDRSALFVVTSGYASPEQLEIGAVYERRETWLVCNVRGVIDPVGKPAASDCSTKQLDRLVVTAFNGAQL
jgi:hypothetical protein